MTSSHTRNAFFYASIVTLGGFVFGLDLGVSARLPEETVF